MLARPILLSNGSPSINCKMNTDFSLTSNYSPLTVTPTTYGTWDSGLWDTAVWGDNLGLTKLWQGITGIGFSGGFELEVASKGIETHWVSTDIVMEVGGVL